MNINIKEAMDCIPLILVFDLDETLFYAQEEECRKYIFTRSAINHLCDHEEDNLKNVEVLDGIHLPKVTAIARKEVKSLLDQVYSIHCLAKDQAIPSPIAVKIITSALYGEAFVKKIFDKFYSDKDNPIFSSNLFPIEYFNRNNYLQPFGYSNAGSVKAELLSHKYPQWQEQMVGLKKENIILIDNDDSNIEGVLNSGFSAIHYPTTSMHLHLNADYDLTKPLIFANLNLLIAAAEATLRKHIASKKSG